MPNSNRENTGCFTELTWKRRFGSADAAAAKKGS